MVITIDASAVNNFTHRVSLCDGCDSFTELWRVFLGKEVHPDSAWVGLCSKCRREYLSGVLKVW